MMLEILKDSRDTKIFNFSIWLLMVSLQGMALLVLYKFLFGAF